MKIALTAIALLLALAAPCLAQDEAHAPEAKQATPEGTPVIAAWDVVPYQIIDKPFSVGVVAFHETGCRVRFTVVQPILPADEAEGTKTIDRVEIKGPGVRHVIVDHPTLNRRTRVWEFHIEIDPSEFKDGPLDVLATAEPLNRGGTGVELPALRLHANAGGTLAFNPPVWADCNEGNDETGDGSEGAPFQTIKKAVHAAGDGGTVYLKAGGDYSPQGIGGGLKRTYWTTITAAPDVAREDVEIGKGRPSTDKLKFKNVTLYADPPKRKYNTILDGEQRKTVVWLDDCKMYNKKGRWEGGGNVFGNRYIGYVTGGITTEMDNGPGAVLLRNHRIHKITSDALTSARVAINVEVRDINPGKTGAHPDWHQSYTGGKDNYKTCIIYNCSGFDCLSQGFFGHNLKDSAFVNCIFHRPPGIGYSQYSGHMDHVLWIHCTVPTQTWLWRGTLHGTNCYVLNGLFNNMKESQGGDTSGLTIRGNHFIKGEPMGDQATTGEPEFVDPDAQDYHVRATSPAARSGVPLQCVPADINGRPRDPKAPTRGCYACPEPKPEE